MKLDKAVLAGAVIALVIFGVVLPAFWTETSTYIEQITLLTYRGLWLLSILLAPHFMRLFIRSLRGRQLTHQGRPVARGSAHHRLIQILLAMLAGPVPITGVFVTLDWLQPYLPV